MSFLLSDLLSQSAQLFPEQTAIADKTMSLTYSELENTCHRLAAALLQDGLEAGTRVGIYAPKAVHTVVAMLAVLQAGGVYVPLDTRSPASRIATICNDCQITFLFTMAPLTPTVQQICEKTPSIKNVYFLDDTRPDVALPETRCWQDLSGAPVCLPRPARIENDLAYILYTSGSTGTPKGVMISHRNALAFIEWGKHTFSVQPHDRLANYAPFHFDLSVFDLFVTLASGATLVLVPPEIAAFPYEIVRWLQRSEITIWYSVPSILRMLLQYGKLETTTLPHLRLILFAGEVFPISHLEPLMQVLPNVEFFNLYGPTETNVCTFYRVPKPPLPAELPIGVACSHSDVFIIQDDGTPGTEGMLWVRGPTVMLGYWPNIQIQQQHPVFPNLAGPFYATGDRVRQGDNGLLTFLGRQDQMIKSRGYRIELGEIESILHRHPEVEQAVVIALPDEMLGHRLEVCYTSQTEKVPTEAEIQQFCTQFLPAYMVPVRWHHYSALPMTGTGKVDRLTLKNELIDKRERKGRDEH